MEKENAIGFLLGAALGGVVAYYALKHQDEIVKTIHDLEDSFDLENNTLINQAKEQMDTLAHNVKSALTRSALKEEGVGNAQEEIDALREEISRLKAQLESKA